MNEQGSQKIIVPLHVSGIWFPVKRSNIRETGSLGTGVNLELYVELENYVLGKCHILINGVKTLIDHSRYICRSTNTDLGVSVKTPIDLGVGYGVSAAASLIHALTIGYVKNDSLIEYADYAHEAEVLYSTGLGDVIAEYYGGLEIRLKPGSPSTGLVRQIPIDQDIELLAVILSGKESTPTMLRRIGGDIYRYGFDLWKKLLKEPCIENFFRYSRKFTEKIFEYTGIDELLKPFNKEIIGYFRKKQALIIWVEREYIDEIYSYLVGKGYKAFKTSINRDGFKIL